MKNLLSDHKPLLVLRSPRTRHSQLNKRGHISQRRHISVGGFHPGRVLTTWLLIYDLFTGSTNHDEALNPLFSGPITFSRGERRNRKTERVSGEKNGATLNALQHMNIAIINSELWLGPSVSLNGPIRVNHCCLQAGLGTH